MDEAWPNAHSLEMDAWFLEIWIFIFIFEKMMMMISFFLKMNETWLNAPSLQIDARLLKTLIFEEKMNFFFFFCLFKMDEAWLNSLVWKYMRIFKKLYCMTNFVGVKNSAKAGPQSAWKHKIRQLGHGWARCRSTLEECQSTLGECRSALLKNIFSILDFETLSQSAANSLNPFKLG